VDVTSHRVRPSTATGTWPSGRCPDENSADEEPGEIRQPSSHSVNINQRASYLRNRVAGMRPEAPEWVPLRKFGGRYTPRPPSHPTVLVVLPAPHVHLHA